jgi:hypothetical protein
MQLKSRQADSFLEGRMAGWLAGWLEIDNNRSKWAIKPFVIGRKKMAVYQYASWRKGQRDYL